jgi:hypothetical protein
LPDNIAKSPEDECKDERNEAFQTLNRDQAEYDKQLLALSAGFLGVALAFVKDVVPLNTTVHLWEFDLALGFLFACICFVLGTFQFGIHGHFRLMDYWEIKESSFKATGDERDRIENELAELLLWVKRKAEWVKHLNRVAGILFVVGTVFLVLFVLSNMYAAAHTTPTSPSAVPKLTESCKGVTKQQ